MVTTLHGTDITLVGNHPFYKPAVTFSINNSDVITCVSESLKQDTLRHFEVTKDIDVVHNFIDTNVSEKVFTDCQRDLMAEPDEKILTHISNLRPVKRLNDVVSVFYKIQQSIKAKLIIVGEGPEREAAEQLIKEYDIANKVIFVGQSNEIDKILCFSDLFLLPSEAESFGLAALEAMVDGVPVISSNAGGLPEVNIHGESGFLSDVGDIDDMAANALKIFKDEKTLKEFKERAKKVAKSFDINTIVPKYESLYQKAIDNIFA
jgi:N-acetyl-alpha-D-glucosaminyl L-malate synthase BshA